MTAQHQAMTWRPERSEVAKSCLVRAVGRVGVSSEIRPSATLLLTDWAPLNQTGRGLELTAFTSREGGR